MRRLWLIVGFLLVGCGGPVAPTSTPVSSLIGTPIPPPTPAPSATLPPPLAAPPIVIYETVSIDATGRYYFPQLISTVRLQVPTTWPEVAMMRQYAFGTAEYRDAARVLLAKAGIFDNTPSRYSSDGNQQVGKPEFTIDNGVATILVTTQVSLYGSYLQWLPIGRLAIDYGGNPALVPDETTAANGASPSLPGDIAVRVMGTIVPSDTSRTVELRLTGMDIVSVTPIPSRDTGTGDLVWSSQTSPVREDIVVAARLRPITKTALATNGNWLPTVQLTLSYIPPLIIAVAFFYLTLSRRWRTNLWAAAGPEAIHLRNVAVAAAAFVGTIGAITVFNSKYEPPSARFGVYQQIVVGLHVLLPLIIFLVATRMLGYPRRWWRGPSRVLVVLAPLVVFNIPAIATRIAPQRIAQGAYEFGRYSWYANDWTARWPVLAFLMLVVTLYLLAGIARILIALWPDGAVRDKLRDKGLLHIGVVVVAALLFLLWLVNTWQSAAPPWLSTSDERLPAWRDTLVSGLMFYPVQLESIVMSLVPLAVLFSAIGLLYALHTVDDSILFSEGQRWAPGALALLFASFVVGTEDRFAGFAIPVGFAIALCLMRALRANPDTMEATVTNALQNAALPANERPRVGRYQREFLLRVRGLEALKRQRTVLESDYSGGKLGYADYASRSIKADDERERLRRGAVERRAGGWVNWKPVTEDLPVRVYLPVPLSPHRLALTTGPENTWWENGRAAVRIALWLIALPLVYIVYLVLSQIHARGQSAYVFWSFLVTGFITSAARWLVLAFVMGALYPYLRGSNGVLKGLWLAAIYAVAVAPGDIWDATFGVRRGSVAVFDVALVLVFLTVLGVAMDWRTLGMRQLPGSSLVDYYQLRNVRNLIAYIVPLVLAAVTIVSQLHTGHIQDAVTQGLKALPNAIPTTSP
jgi:hypothetical protein